MNAEFDSELRQDFLVEAGELLQRLGEQLVGLEAAPGDGELLNAVFRAFHTVKGGAGFLALEPMVVLCHHAEDLLNEARNGKVVLGAVHMDALLEALDLLNDMMAAVSTEAPLDMPPPALLQSLLPGARPAPVVAPAATPAPSADGGAIDDSEFEALLDSMYGSAAPGTVAPAALPVAPAASATIDDDEFEALLDALHGKAGQPAAVAAMAPAAVAEMVAPKPAAATAAHHAAPAENSVRVDTARLDLLVNHAGELVLVRNRLLSLAARHGSEVLAAAAGELDRVTDELQNAVMGMRMQPVGRLFQRFPRIVRDLARQLGKDVELVLEGEGTDLDRSLVEALADPLIHLLRNALDHGVEQPAERERAGKPRKGRVCLSASQRGERIVIAVRDDGRGMDPAILRRKAVEKGVIDAAQASRLSEAECYELIFRPGFSTAAAVSDISGRGVGMDVVKTRVAELGGTLQVRSQLGHGSELELTVPLTLAVLRVLMVRVGTRLFALPMGNVEEVFELDADQDCLLDGRLVARHRGRALPLLDLAGWAAAMVAAGRHVVVLHIGHQRLGCLVHEVLGREDVIVKPLGPLFDGVPGIAGATVTGDGRLALVMDLAGLAGDAGQLSTSPQLTG
ncbi:MULTISPECIES: chemotaxis protein CheA [Rhodanobacter]|uniref:chemotaxis protein CheA n=1 Tax=Rhodanobacter TaxID=75309 RepID=UPI000416011F|nr:MULTISPECIES: chemotaxis protein CheA [Rhodanobacter]KZC20750.1 chemotaxis protein CheA [Rhodanobacter denitrificans]UJJ50165.1 chemotaxis protein CheA [Rhodanobacter denitrificans]UJM92880.1 chemotaxis protein CheA [Rhodanobacter denitrificans]UJM96410.1 chemotaxis protein CheA [Rhodanobacter denitrificans]UJN20759.1 chemotaxis protein CheA [Rhodanobacter denitrificans]